MNLDEARSLATWWQQELLRHGCLEAEIAGSIRRQRPEPRDIELVACPAWQNDLMGEPSSHNLDAWVQRQASLSPIKGGGPAARYYQLQDQVTGVKVDLFVADRNNFGLILAIRTGSADFSHGLARHANRCGYHFHGGRLCAGFEYGINADNCRGLEVLPTPRERDVFAALGLRWVEPAGRAGEADVKRAWHPEEVSL